MFDPLTIGTILIVFIFAGTVKGVIGLGLPTISLALLSVAIDLPSAMALLLVPSFTANIWQATVGGKFAFIFRRIWPFLIMATVTVWLGALALTRVDSSLLSALLGVLLFAYATLGLSGYRLVLSRRREFWVGPLVGAANGVLTGMTGSFVVPGVMFLQSIGLPRDSLIQAMGMLFILSTLALALALKENGLLSTEIGLVSLMAVVPALAGMRLGQHIRHHLSEERFKRVFFLALLPLGMYITVTNLVLQ